MDSTTPTDTPVGGTSNPQTLDVNVSADGIIVGTGFGAGANPPTQNWTGITKVGQEGEDLGASAWSFSMAYDLFAAAQTPQAVEASFADSPTITGSITAPFR